MPVGVRASLNRLQDTLHVDVSASPQHETVRGAEEHQRAVLGERMKRTELRHPHVQVRLSKIVDNSRTADDAGLLILRKVSRTV